MATNRSLLCTFFVLLSIIIVSICANRLGDQDNDNNHVDRLADQDMYSVSRRIDFYLGCFQLFKRYRFPFGEEYDSIQDEIGANICHTSLGVMQSMYENTGRLLPGYKEALLIWNNNNQTIVDIEICQYDHRRCPDELQEIAFSDLFDDI